METVDLPKGWFKEEVVRKSGLSAGKTDIYYYGPDGKKYRSKPQIARELGANCDLTPFDFKSGAMISQSSVVRRAKGKKTSHDHAKGFRGETGLTLPVRQTASIFKQPVTLIRSHADSPVRQDLKHGPADSLPPRQLFWEKSLTDLQCSGMNEETLKCITLPSKIKGIGPDLSTENLLQSIAAALHLSTNPVVGQSQSVAKFAKNPTVHINTSQPLIQQVIITDEDIRQQETKVEGARKKLEELLAAIEKSGREKLLLEDKADAEGRDSLTPSPSPGATKRKADDLQEQDLTPPAKVEKKPEEREDNCKTDAEELSAPANPELANQTTADSSASGSESDNGTGAEESVEKATPQPTDTDNEPTKEINVESTRKAVEDVDEGSHTDAVSETANSEKDNTEEDNPKGDSVEGGSVEGGSVDSPSEGTGNTEPTAKEPEDMESSVLDKSEELSDEDVDEKTADALLGDEEAVAMDTN